MSIYLPVGLSVCPKTLWQPRKPKNGSIWLKFGTLFPWVNTWGAFFHFLKILIFGVFMGPKTPQNGPQTFGAY